MKLRVGIDVGGTFTDVTAFDEDQGELVAVRKYVSNPAQPAAVMETITADLARDFGADAVTLILHGSTAALNTLLEGKGVRTGLLTTRGFRDVYEIGRQWRGEDVARGYVSRASARDDYGVALDADLAVDDAATARLRGEKTAR